MEIEVEKGNKFIGDKMFLVTTEKREVFTIFKLCELINLLAHNEWRIKEKGGWKRYLFQEAVLGSLEMGKKGIVFTDKSSIPEIKEWCENCHLKFEKIEPELQKLQQLKLRDF